MKIESFNFESLDIQIPSFEFIPFIQPKNIDDEIQGVLDVSINGMLKITEYAETACSSITGVKKTACSTFPRTAKPLEWYRQNPPPGFKPLPISNKDHKIQPLSGYSSDDGKIIDIDMDVKDPLLCPDIANDIFHNLFMDEPQKRPATNYMEKIQKHIHPPTRASCIDWLVGAAQKLNLVPNTLHLAVSCMDRYLSGNEVDHKMLRLLGLTCMIIASKYEEIRQPHFDFDAYTCISKSMFSRKDFIQMERSVLSYLNYEVTAPTTWSYIERFVRAAQAGKESSAVHGLECMASYIAELSLLSYSMLEFLPSTIAASSVFLALYILDPLKRPWNATLEHYTLYEPSDLRDCVLALNEFCRKISFRSNLTTIISKYGQKKYECVALKNFPSSIPPEIFQNLWV